MSNYNKICTVIVSISVMILHYYITMVMWQKGGDNNDKDQTGSFGSAGRNVVFDSWNV